jgi:hypothetical protein
VRETHPGVEDTTLRVSTRDSGLAGTHLGRHRRIALRMAAQMLLCFADRGGYERSYVRATDGGDDFGGGVVAGRRGDAAVGDGADGEPVGAWGVHPDEGEGGSGDAAVHPVAPGTVFGDCQALPGGRERVSGGDRKGRGELANAEGAGSGE